jgi:hypothetical protein
MKYMGIVLGFIGALWTIVWSVIVGFQRGYPEYTWLENNIYPWILFPLVILMPFLSNDKTYKYIALVLSFFAGSFGLGSYYLWISGWPCATPRLINNLDVLIAWLIGGCIVTVTMMYIFRMLNARLKVKKQE